MNVLIACEESQEVCKAFRSRGHRAFSCDIQPCSGGHPEWHIQDDALKYINGKLHMFDLFLITQDGEVHEMPEKWDLIIAHPPCTYLSNAGARWLHAGSELNLERFCRGIEAKNFFMKFLDADCEKICVENPIPSRTYKMPQYTQIIQPYEFGHPYSKKTCLWLKGLPMLKPTKICKSYKPYCSSGSYSKNHDPKYKGASRKGGSAKSRSKTFKGIAEAMAEQWG